MKILISIIFIFTFFVSCNDSGGSKGFSNLEDSDETVDGSDSVTEEIDVVIESVSPITDPVVLISSSTQTFAVQVNSGAGSVDYNFKLDGAVVQSSSSPFYNLSAGAITSGNHTLEVIATNSISSDNYIFNIRKNTAPTINLNANTSQTISCVADSFQLDIVATDIDGDSITYSFYLNGAIGSSFLANSSGVGTASSVFTPNCTLTGNNNVTIRATDSNGEYSEYTMAVTVTNPNVASIDSYSPTGNPVVVLSTETKNFIISATGNPPLSYEWDINPGSTIAACDDLTTCPIAGTDFTPGNYVLTATVTDVLSSTDSHAFNVTLNEKPGISFQTPSNASTIKMNCASNKNFQLTITDANWADGQSHTVTWQFDGGTNAALTNTNTLGVYPMTTAATFSPNCAASLIGDHTIKAIISDGYETQEVQWDVTVNYFSDTCNNLASGETCTLAGMKGMGSGLTDSDPELRIRADFIEKHTGGGFFFSDGIRHSIWFYNNTAGSINVLGKAVAANTVVNLFGQTLGGLGTDGQSYNNFYLNSPQAMAYSNSEDALYVADYSNHRIVRFNSSGVGYYWAAKNGGNNTDGDLRKNAKCNNPLGMELDEADNKLFVTCYGNTSGSDGAIKYFSTSADEAYTLVRYAANAATEGSNGYGGGARFARAYAIARDPNSKIIYAGDNQKCRMVAISYGDTGSFHGGAVSLGANGMKIIANGNGCGESFSSLWSSTAAKLRMFDLDVYVVGGVTKGIFYSNTTRHYVGLLNVSGADITLGGKTISAGYNANIFGKNNVADYSRGEPAYLNTIMNSSLGILVDGNTLYVADRNNGKIATLDISTADGASDDFVGNLKINDYDNELPKQANLRQFYRPRTLEYSSGDNSLMIYDFGNQRLRKLSLDTGDVTTLIGRGATGDSDSQTEDPDLVYFRNIGDLFANGDASYLFYTDYIGSNGTNRTCKARVLNRSGATQTLFDQSIPDNFVNDLAGEYAIGCNTWNSGTYNNTAAISARLNYPTGIVVNSDQTKLYIGDYTADCIFQVDNSGVISEFIGQCTSGGDISGDFATTKLNAPGDFSLDSDAVHGANGNFFLVDRWITTTSYIKYANVSGTDATFFGGVTVPAGEVGKLITTEGYSGAVASFGDQICYTQGANANAYQYPHNVICMDRNTGLTTLRVGKISASTVKAASAHYDEEEGVVASSATLSSPWGLAFDSDGNLYIASYSAHNIRMVKRWF